MKGIIQMWGILLTFILVVLMIPQLMVFSVTYRQCSSITSNVVEIIETNEGVTKGAEEKMNAIKLKYSRFVIGYNKEEIAEKEYSYTIVVSKPMKLFGSSFTINVTSSKKTKRVIY